MPNIAGYSLGDIVPKAGDQQASKARKPPVATERTVVRHVTSVSGGGHMHCHRHAISLPRIEMIDGAFA